MNVAILISKLKLPDRSYVVVGSGILGALGIRESGMRHDGSFQAVYNELEQSGWNHYAW